VVRHQEILGVLVSDSWHKGSNATSLGSLEVHQEKVMLVGDFPMLIPSSPIDSICALATVQRLQGKIIRTVPCCIWCKSGLWPQPRPFRGSLSS